MEFSCRLIKCLWPSNAGRGRETGVRTIIFKNLIKIDRLTQYLAVKKIPLKWFLLNIDGINSK